MIRIILLLALLWGLRQGHQSYKEEIVSTPVSADTIATSTPRGLVEITGQVLRCEDNESGNVKYQLDCKGITITVIGTPDCPIINNLEWITVKGKVLAPKIILVNNKNRIQLSNMQAAVHYSKKSRLVAKHLERIQFLVKDARLGKKLNNNWREIFYKDSDNNTWGQTKISNYQAIEFLEDNPNTLKGFISKKGVFIIESWQK